MKTCIHCNSVTDEEVVRTYTNTKMYTGEKYGRATTRTVRVSAGVFHQSCQDAYLASVAAWEAMTDEERESQLRAQRKAKMEARRELRKRIMEEAEANGQDPEQAWYDYEEAEEEAK